MSVQSVLFVHLAFLYGPSPHAPGEFMRGWEPLHPPAGAPPCSRVSLCGAGSPCTHHAGAPREHGKAMLGTQGDFPDAGKSPKARQGLPPLDPAIAKFPPSLVLRCACTRAAFCHNKRPICHFKLAGKSVFYFSPSLTGVTLPAVNSWRGKGVPRTLNGLTHHNQSC